MASLADIRARIAAQENKNQKGSSATQSDKAVYAHWNMPVGTTAQVRFLPDGDETNSYFWAERLVIKLPFNGIKGDPNVKQITVQVPCVEMYGENCPILSEVRPWYKDETLKEMANKYWKKRSYIFQGFVRQNPIGDDVTPPNPIRRFILTPQLIPIVKAGLMDPDMEELPTHYTRGTDFMFRKTQKGNEYAEYTTSSWMRKESPLTEAELAAIEAHSLFILKDFLPKKPSESELRVIKEMFEASVDGRPYDTDKWGAYYRPFGIEAPAGTKTEAPAAPAAQTSGPDEDEPPFTASQPIVKPSSAPSSDKAADILAKIKARQKQA